jgi:hypothetical protein
MPSLTQERADGLLDWGLAQAQKQIAETLMRKEQGDDRGCGTGA